MPSTDVFIAEERLTNKLKISKSTLYFSIKSNFPNELWFQIPNFLTVMAKMRKKTKQTNKQTKKIDTSLIEKSILLVFFFFDGLKSMSTKWSAYLHFTATHIPISYNKGQ